MIENLIDTAKRFRVVITDSDYPTNEPERKIMHKIGATVAKYDCVTEEEVMKIARDADALLVQYAPITKQVIDTLDKVKAVGRYGVGVDTIDIQAATEKGIQIVNVIYDIRDVADHTMALLLALQRKIYKVCQATRAGRWDWKEFKPIFRMSHSTAGIIGFGRVGRELALRMKGFGCHLLGYDPFVSENVFAEMGVEKVDLEKLLTLSDFVIISSALTAGSFHIIDERQLTSMKKTSFLINTSRGSLIKESSLIKALEEHWIAGAALDVLEQEPVRPDSPFLGFDNVILSPHMAWYSEESVNEIQTICAEEVARILVGELPKNLVNPEVLSKLKRI
jgi:D-3-phosphoglycerate dehydrogenase